MPPQLVVGLGNPGKEYDATRHNVGFMVVDETARRFGVSKWKTHDNARQAFDSSRRVVFVEPQSFMNASGTPVRVIAAWYRTPPSEVLVISDDMDLPFGRLRMRARGGHGGHNGLRSIIDAIGDEFPRIRVGVSRPTSDSIDHVLSPFDPLERAALPKIIAAAADGVESWLNDSLSTAMQSVNSWTGLRKGSAFGG